jgi:stringent starvation protein B
MIDAPDASSTRPYLIRALYEWCTDNGFTPYVAVAVDDTVAVPPEFVRQGEIVLNISFDATSSLKLGNELIEFKARFGGVPRDIVVPIDRVMAVYARENGQGMSFPMGTGSISSGETRATGGGADGKITSRTPRKTPVLRQVTRSAEGDGQEVTDNKVVSLLPVASPDSDDPQPPSSPSGGRPALTRVK